MSALASQSKSEAHGVLGPVGTGGFRPRPAIGGGAARRLTAAMQAMETVGPIGPIEVPTPAHAVRLRRPVCLTATYVVACTALLVSVSLLPFGSGATAPVAMCRLRRTSMRIIPRRSGGRIAICCFSSGSGSVISASA